MRPIDWLFTLLRKFVPMQDIEYSNMKIEADAWEVKMLATPVEGEKVGQFKKYYMEYAGKWYVKLLFAVSWLFMVKWISDWMTEQKDEKDPAKVW